MDYKIFIQKSDEALENMSIEELRVCLHNIARKISESKREPFLQLLEDCRYQSDREDNKDKCQYKRLMPNEKVKEKLRGIKTIFGQIEDGELCLSAQGYEDYSNGYWSSEWIWEYKDNEGIGSIIEDAVMFAYDCVNDCRYEEAATIFELVMDTQIFVEDEYGGDSFALSLDEMVDENLIGLNLKTLALNVLYTEYQIQPADKRAENLFSYFSYPYFKGIRIEEIFPIGREELRNTEMFFQSWINFLKQQRGEIASRLLKEGILHYKGIDGLVEMAGQSYKEHPSLYLATMLEYERGHDYGKMKETGKVALEKLDCDLKIRGEIAMKVAQASYCVNDIKLMKKCWYEAFLSNSTIPNYLRLFADEEVTKKYKDIAEKRIKQLPISSNHYKQHISEDTKNSITEIEKKYLHFFSGSFDKIINWCMEQKNPLGWTGNFIVYGVDLMLLYLYSDHKLRKAVKEIATLVSNRMGFNESKNLVFMKENSVFEADISLQKGQEIFWGIFLLWKANYTLSVEDIESHVEWLESIIDKRIDGIVGGKYRNKYHDVALLAAALGEVKESLGMDMTKNIVISRYLTRYPRHTAFRGALKEYMD